MIAIISNQEETTAQWVRDRLEQRGCPSVFIDFDNFPAKDRLVLQHGGGAAPTMIYRSATHGDIDLATIRSIFWWRPATPKAAASLADQGIADDIAEASTEILHSVFDDLDCFHFPCNRHNMRQARLKLPQLALAARLGFKIPETLVTNDPDAFIEFCNRADSRVITKPTVGAPPPHRNGVYFGYASLVEPRDLVRFQDIRLCPFTAQHYVPKQVELRVSVVGPDVFAAEIHSQTTNRTKVDWRHYDYGGTPYYPHRLPDEVADLCRQLVRRMGLHYGAIDMVLTPTGEYYFLEINPAGHFGWIEDKTGLPISNRIAQMLAEHG